MDFSEIEKLVVMYVLGGEDGRTPVGTHDPFLFSQMLSNIKARTVCKTEVGDVEVSTVFVGMDMNYLRWHPQCPDKRPYTFETMVFDPNHSGDAEVVRYPTWEEAQKGHDEIVLSYSTPREKPVTKEYIRKLAKDIFKR